MGVRFGRTTRHKGQALELKVLHEIMCNFFDFSIQVIINLCSRFNYYYYNYYLFIYLFLQNKDFIIMYLQFLFFSYLYYVRLIVTTGNNLARVFLLSKREK